MNSTIKIITLVVSIFLISCNGGLDQTKINGENPDKVGEYFYNMFKNNNQDEFKKWIDDANRLESFWGYTQNYRGKPFSWKTSEYEKSVITQKYNWDEYFIDIYFNDKEDNHSYRITFLLNKEKENKDNKYYMETCCGYAPIIRPNK